MTISCQTKKLAAHVYCNAEDSGERHSSSRVCTYSDGSLARHSGPSHQPHPCDILKGEAETWSFPVCKQNRVCLSTGNLRSTSTSTSSRSSLSGYLCDASRTHLQRYTANIGSKQMVPLYEYNVCKYKAWYDWYC